MPATRWRERLIAVTVLAACSLAVGLVVPPTDELPHCDDWDYVETARHFLATGRMVLSDWPAFTLVGHVLWGSLFGAILGPSYFAFRLSMFVMSWLGAMGIYEWGRDSGRSQCQAIWIAAVVLLNPLNMVYQNSFMSDVTSVTAFIWLAVLLNRRPQHRALSSVGTGLLAAFGYLARQTAVIPLIADCLIEAMKVVRGRRLDRRLLITLATFAPFVVGYWGWLFIRGTPYSTSVTARTALPAPVELVERLTILALATSLYLAPVWIGGWSQIRFRVVRKGLIAWGSLLAIMLVLNRGLPAPYERQEVFDLGIGFSDSIVEMQHLEGPAVEAFGTRVSVFRVGTTLLAVLSLFAAAQLATQLRASDLLQSRGFVRSSLSLSILVGLLCIVPTMHGRYAWPVCVAVLMAWQFTVVPTERSSFPGVGLLLTAIYAIGGLLGLQDNSVCQKTIWQAIHQLEAQGVDPNEINAGLEYGGLRRFTPHYRGEEHRGPYLARLSPLHRDAEIVVNSPFNIFAPRRQYSVTYGPLPGTDVIDELEFRSWWRTGKISILERR
ncbi:hypothetical protein Pan44_37840 [Caulifigura coniformis]|uniref:Glycosyltransferase RgtA/B/C/D-like domain-containing protein n=1 Tax=Caulifigura coniformis TaxID=2527983 RepID=A0A517SI01_9PLAN|nr:hypothetical protein [Caulifigura coniformis]QDT55737.1 hypothetical protein Pan44_37840 [Caulifigura coniformis]